MGRGVVSLPASRQTRESARVRIGISLLGVTHEMGGHFQYATTMLGDLAEKYSCEELVVFVDDLSALRAEIVALPPAQYVEVPAESRSRVRMALRFFLGHIGGKSRNTWIRGRYGVFDEQGCDVIFYPYWDFAPVISSTPAIAAILDCAPRVAPELMPWRARRALDLLIRSIARHARVVLTESELTREHLATHYGVDPRKVVSLPLKPPRYLFNGKGRDAADVLARHGLRPGYLFLPGRFGSYHNTERVLAAMRLLLSRDPAIDVRAVLVGVRDSEMDAARSCIKALGLQSVVALIGFVPDEDMAALYQSAAAMPFPSLLGPSSIPLCEAMALGCPVIVSTIEGHADLVGDAGIFINPYDTEEIASAIRALLVNPSARADLRAKGLRRFSALQSFDHAGTLQRLAMDVMQKRASVY